MKSFWCSRLHASFFLLASPPPLFSSLSNWGCKSHTISTFNTIHMNFLKQRKKCLQVFIMARIVIFFNRYLNTFYRPQELIQPQANYLIVRTDVNLAMQNTSHWTLSQAKVQEYEVGKFPRWTGMVQIYYNAWEFLPKT